MPDTMPERLTITVTQEHFDRGVAAYGPQSNWLISTVCGMTRAIRDAYPGDSRKASAGCSTATVMGERYWMDMAGRAVVRAFDNIVYGLDDPDNKRKANPRDHELKLPLTVELTIMKGHLDDPYRVISSKAV